MINGLVIKELRKDLKGICVVLQNKDEISKILNFRGCCFEITDNNNVLMDGIVHFISSSEEKEFDAVIITSQ